MYVCIHIYIYICIYVTVPEKVRLASQFATQNFFGSFLKSNLDSVFHSVVIHFPHIKLISPTYKIKNAIYLEYYIIIIVTQLLQIATQFTL